MGKKFDFGGWATRANLLCSDGRIIRENAFEECDGKRVPLVWNHQHNDPDAVLGHALLENRGDGVYAYCTFNDTQAGQNAKLLVQHGDVDQLSIYANKLKQQGRDVIHGVIREVSLVLAGANSGAKIDSVVMHSDDSYEEGYIYTGEFLDDVESIEHADKEKKGEPEMAEETKKQGAADNSEKTVADVFDTLTDEQKTVVYAIIGQALEEASSGTSDGASEKEEIKHSKEGSEPTNDDEKTVADVFDTLTDEQKTVVYAIIGQALEDNDEDDDEEDEGGNDDMKHNVFDKETANDEVLSHSEMLEIM